jgi:DNA replicative helicase MCM subunit Mcm2 (Cdc46/Mcm family)
VLLQAVAKLRFDDNVVRSDIDAAIALMRASQASIEPELQKRTREDPVSRLYMVRPAIAIYMCICNTSKACSAVIQCLQQHTAAGSSACWEL